MKKFFESTFFVSLCHPFSSKNRKEKRKEIGERREAIKQKIFLENSQLIFQKLSIAIQSFNEPIKVWLEFGTLLGCYRDGDVIAHDNDIDFGVEDSIFVDSFIDHLVNNGFDWVKYFTIHSDSNKDLNTFIAEYTISYKGLVNIDFFVFRTMGNKKYSYHFDAGNEGWEGKLIVNCIEMDSFNLEECYFKGAKFYIPDNAGEHLASIYGNDFMTPKIYYYCDREKDFEYVVNDVYALKTMNMHS